jgi:hypothetical protein
VRGGTSLLWRTKTETSICTGLLKAFVARFASVKISSNGVARLNEVECLTLLVR